MTSFERYFSKLSENHKIVDTGTTVKVMAVEGVPKLSIKLQRVGVVEHLSTAISPIQCHTFYDILKA